MKIVFIIAMLMVPVMGDCEEYRVYDTGSTKMIIDSDGNRATIHKEGATENWSDQFGNIVTKRKQGSVEVITVNPHREFTEQSRERTRNAH